SSFTTGAALMDTRSPPVGLHSPEAAVPFKMEKPPRSRRLDVGRDDPGRLFGQPPPALVDRSRVHGANTRTADRGPSRLNLSDFLSLWERKPEGQVKACPYSSGSFTRRRSGSSMTTNEGSARLAHSSTPSTPHR